MTECIKGAYTAIFQSFREKTLLKPGDSEIQGFRRLCLKSNCRNKRSCDKHGIKYNRYDNSFTYISDIEKAQELADKIESLKLCGRLGAFAARINPFLSRIHEIFHQSYCWCVDQCEYATDIMFNSREDLENIYPALVEHVKCEDVMTFLGRKMHNAFQGEIVSDIKYRPQGIRIKP